MATMETSGEAVEIWEAAELLGLSIPEVYDLLFSRQLASVEAANGRRLVPRAAIEAWNTGQTSVSA